MESSLGHFLALKKKIRKSIREWDSKTVQTWVAKVGFEFIQKLIMYGRINGAQLVSADYEWMRDALGIEDENECQVFQKKIQEVSVSCVEECCVYGWGNNKHGQLASGKALIFG